MSSEPIRILFNSWLLEAYKYNGQLYIACKPICEVIGISWQAQNAKLKADSRLNYHDIVTVAADGKERSMGSIPKSKLGAWLYSINPRKVNYEYRQKLEQFQENVVSVIDSYLSNELTNEKMKHFEDVILELRIEMAEVRAENDYLRKDNARLRKERSGGADRYIPTRDLNKRSY